MKVQPPTFAEVAVLGGVIVLGYLAYSAYSKITTVTTDQVIAGAASAVDKRSDVSSTLGGVQGWVDDTVRKGQDAGASSFATSFFTGLFK